MCQRITRQSNAAKSGGRRGKRDAIEAIIEAVIHSDWLMRVITTNNITLLLLICVSYGIKCSLDLP